MDKPSLSKSFHEVVQHYLKEDPKVLHEVVSFLEEEINAKNKHKCECPCHSEGTYPYSSTGCGALCWHSSWEE